MVLYIGDKPVGLMKVVEKKVPKTKFGLSIDNLIGDVDENGVLSNNLTTKDVVEFNFAGVKELSRYALAYNKFSNIVCKYKFLCPDLEIIGYYSLHSACLYESGTNSVLVGVDFSNVKVVGEYGMYSFADTNGLGANSVGTLDMNKLETVGNYGMQYAFRGVGITEIKLDSLTTVGTGGMQACFYRSGLLGDAGITKPIYFPSLISVQANSFGTTSATRQIFYNQPNIPEIHFRADMQATIEAMTGYANKWGATNASIIFDL